MRKRTTRRRRFMVILSEIMKLRNPEVQVEALYVLSFQYLRISRDLKEGEEKAKKDR